jgi:hypothetical protein
MLTRAVSLQYDTSLQLNHLKTEDTMTPLERAYHEAGMEPPPPLDIETPAQLLQCWESLTPNDRIILVRFAQLLSAEDMTPAGANLLQSTYPLTYDELERHLKEWRLSQQRQRRKGQRTGT